MDYEKLVILLLSPDKDNCVVAMNILKGMDATEVFDCLVSALDEAIKKRISKGSKTLFSALCYYDESEYESGWHNKLYFYSNLEESLLTFKTTISVCLASDKYIFFHIEGGLYSYRPETDEEKETFMHDFIKTLEVHGY